MATGYTYMHHFLLSCFYRFLKKRRWWKFNRLVIAALVLAHSLAAQPAVRPNLYGIGDKGMAGQQLTSSYRGWMQMLPMFFSLDTHIENLAENDLDIHRFMLSEAWKDLQGKLRPADYVLISFSNIDSDSTALHRLVRQVKKRKATPVIVIPEKEPGRPERLKIPNIQIIRYSEHVAYSSNGLLSVYGAMNIAREIALKLQTAFAALDSSRSGQPLHNPAMASESPADQADAVSDVLKLEADMKFRTLSLPGDETARRLWAPALRKRLMEFCGARAYHDLDVDMHETGVIQKDDYLIRKIYFQGRPGIYVTADLYVPKGKGPFPAVINMHGHWPGGKAGDMVQAVAISLAENGYVCLNIDAWGAGERTTQQGVAEYHGAGLGASLMNIGETLLGCQLTDNMRGVDLLCSLPYVDADRIGATGASGGGNQTMWLSALDTRIKASMPVVSVGTFQSYIMGSNCFCELMPGGLTCTEEAGILGLIAPRSVKICNGLLDPSATFAPAQMLRSYTNAKKVFTIAGQPDNIQYQLFNTPHGYFPETRMVLLGWFNQKLKGKGDGRPLPEKPFSLLAEQKLLVFENAKRPAEIATTISFERKHIRELEAAVLKRSKIERQQVKSQLKKVLMLPDHPDRLVKNIAGNDVQLDKKSVWVTGQLITENRHLISYRYKRPASPNGRVLVVCPPDSAGTLADGSFSQNYTQRYFRNLIAQYSQSGDGVFIATLWDLGKEGSVTGRRINGALPLFHTESRAELWLGRTMIGEWVSDLNVVAGFIQKGMPGVHMDLAAGKELTVAALASAALYGFFGQLYLYQMPLAYIFNNAKEANFFNMAVHLPGYLNWGGAPMLAAMAAEVKIVFSSPLTLGGTALSADQKNNFIELYHHLAAAMGTHNILLFN